MKLKFVAYSIALLFAGIVAGAYLLNYLNEKEETESRDIDRAFSQVKAKFPNVARYVSPFILNDKNYASVLDECEKLALLAINYVKAPDAGQPFKRFEAVSSDSTFNDANILLFDTVGATGRRHLFGCYIDSDMTAKSGRFIFYTQ